MQAADSTIATVKSAGKFHVMLKRLVYASGATDAVGIDLAAILDQSRQANTDLNVTGVLCFLDGVYMQYLEGDEATVEELFGRIRSDPRHCDIAPLERRAVPRRMFPGWTMAPGGDRQHEGDLPQLFARHTA